jgi:hypothetical protein
MKNRRVCPECGYRVSRLLPGPMHPSCEPTICTCASPEVTGMQCRYCMRPVATEEFLASAARGRARLDAQRAAVVDGQRVGRAGVEATVEATAGAGVA